MGLASLIAASGALLGALITLALALPPNRHTAANQQLAALMGLVTVYQLSTMARHAPDIQWLGPLLPLSLSIFLLGPGLYLYTRARIDHDSQWRRAQLWHTLPFALLLLDAVAGTTLATRYPHTIGVLCYLHLLAYLGISLRLLGRARRQAELPPAALRWLASLLWGCTALALPGLLFAMGRWLPGTIGWPQQLWSITLTVGMSYLIAFFAVLDPSVFHASRSARADRKATKARYETSSLGDEQAQQLWQQLQALMQDSQPYLQPQLKVGELARQLAVPPSHLSQTINQVGGCSFASFLNGYRIETAKTLLRSSQPGERTMLDIALSSGFNSESVFYKQFRALVGQTPRQYQQQG
ncbi:helix-turn-helix transcriptional regulator [Parahaliea mediterranea]|uniref:helix-turn-helix transcriptional regulator n=1 Tax=Parahaliea mediterranea TaxID=651086 RepID=UPI000E2E94AD|nr:helix-turn-helix transcriptional regulator [Parahaliea mediterranea]